jgi:hypothetical protein
LLNANRMARLSCDGAVTGIPQGIGRFWSPLGGL